MNQQFLGHFTISSSLNVEQHFSRALSTHSPSYITQILSHFSCQHFNMPWHLIRNTPKAISDIPESPFSSSKIHSFEAFSPISANEFLMCYFLHHKAAKYDGDLIKKNVQRCINCLVGMERKIESDDDKMKSNVKQSWNWVEKIKNKNFSPSKTIFCTSFNEIPFNILQERAFLSFQSWMSSSS